MQILPQFNLALAARGSPRFAPGLAWLLPSLVSSFDDFRERAAEICAVCQDEMEDALARSAFGPDFELFVGGFSEDGSPAAWAISSSGGRGLAIEGVACAPFDGPVRAEFARAFPPDTDPNDIDPVRDGLAILEMQRHHPVSHGSGTSDFDDRTPRRLGRTKVFSVGGFAQLTTVARDQVMTKIIRRWPDEIGQRIKPAC